MQKYTDTGEGKDPPLFNNNYSSLSQVMAM